MSIEPDQIRARVEALLAGLPGDGDGQADPQAEIDELARGLAAAHDFLVQALESVERG